MRFHTPVLFADDPAVIAEAAERGWTVVVREGPRLRFAGLNPDETVTVPENAMNIERGSLSGPPAAAWANVAAWLEKYVHRPLPVVAPNGYAMDLALWGAASRGWPVGVWLGETFPVLSPGAVALLTSAVGFLIPDPDHRAEFASRWPVPFVDLPDTPLVPVPSRQSPSDARRVEGVTRVLLVGYYSGDCATVGVQRVNYWFEEIGRLSEGRIQVDIATAVDAWPAETEQVHVVPDLGAAGLATGVGALEPWATATLAGYRDRAYPPSAHVGGHWTWRLQDYFDARDDQYDVVILSGNPFPYFDFAHYARRRWYARTVVDYRDPFALNPRATMSDDARDDAVLTEAGWNLQADVVTVVNQACRRLAVSSGPDSRVEVIANGFDERAGAVARPAERAEGPVRLAHAGQVFTQSPVDPLLRAAARTGVELHHLGRPIEDAHGAALTNYGRVDRATVLERLAEADCGVAYVTSSGIETPTKVFDYLLAGLDVLLLHRGAVEESALAAMLDGVDGVHWVHDDEETITRFLADYVPEQHPDPARAAPLSRESTTRGLVAIIDELGDHRFHLPARA